MLNKHFFKSLVIFTLIIIFGLLGVFLVAQFDKQGDTDSKNIELAK